MQHIESFYYHMDHVEDIMVLKKWMRYNSSHEYNTEPINLKKGIHRADFIIEDSEQKIQYVVNGIRRKLESLGYY